MCRCGGHIGGRVLSDGRGARTARRPFTADASFHGRGFCSRKGAGSHTMSCITCTLARSLPHNNQPQNPPRTPLSQSPFPHNQPRHPFCCSRWRRSAREKRPVPCNVRPAPDAPTVKHPWLCLPRPPWGQTPPLHTPGSPPFTQVQVSAELLLASSPTPFSVCPLAALQI